MKNRAREKGYYFGTVIDEKWWKRDREKHFFSRGNGEYWFEEDRFCFRKYLSEAPLKIPFDAIERVDLGKWHAGKWGGGLPVVKIVWSKKGRRVSSGFILGKKGKKSLEAAERLKRAIPSEGEARE